MGIYGIPTFNETINFPFRHSVTKIIIARCSCIRFWLNTESNIEYFPKRRCRIGMKIHYPPTPQPSNPMKIKGNKNNTIHRSHSSLKLIDKSMYCETFDWRIVRQNRMSSIFFFVVQFNIRPLSINLKHFTIFARNSYKTFALKHSSIIKLDMKNILEYLGRKY